MGDLGVKTVADAFDLMENGRKHMVDAVKVTHPEGSTFSINVVTWGMARDAAETAEGLRWLGPLRYDIAGFFHILKNKENYGAIGVDANQSGAITEASSDFLMMFAQNTRCSGRGFCFSPLAKLDDGKFDVLVCNKTNVFHTIGLFDKVKTAGSHVEDQCVQPPLPPPMAPAYFVTKLHLNLLFTDTLFYFIFLTVVVQVGALCSGE